MTRLLLWRCWCPQESYSNPWGFMRKGKLLEDLDACAGADNPRFIQPCFVVQRQTSLVHMHHVSYHSFPFVNKSLHGEACFWVPWCGGV